MQPFMPAKSSPPQPILPNAPRSSNVQPFTAAKPAIPQPILSPALRSVAIQRSAGNAFALPPGFQLRSSGLGQRLPEAIQKKMEPVFGSDFSDVRVHVGNEASTIGALAFAHGTDLYFAPGHYNPQTTHGQKLLGHELTHVLQQKAGRVRNPLGSGVAVVQDPALEAEAERMGTRAASATVSIQAKPLVIGPVLARFSATNSRPRTAKATGAILPSRSPANVSVQRKPRPVLPGQQHAQGKAVSGTIFPSRRAVAAAMSVFSYARVAQAKSQKNVNVGKGQYKKVWIADSAIEAESELTSFCATLGIGWNSLSQGAREQLIKVAQDAGQGGLDQAESMLVSESQDVIREKNRQNRWDKSEGDWAELETVLDEESLTYRCAYLSRAAYVGGENPNPTLSGEYTAEEIYDAIREWRDLGPYECAKNFHAFDPQNKAAAGKGNVGQTLDTRSWQANLICEWGNKKINVHVNLQRG